MLNTANQISLSQFIYNTIAFRIYNQYMISGLSEISTGNISNLEAQEVWDQVIRDKIKVLQHLYQKANKHDTQKIEKISKLLGELKSKIKQSKYNSQGKYFQKFQKTQQRKYFPINATLEKIKESFSQRVEKQSIQVSAMDQESKFDLKQTQKQQLNNYQALLLKNHKQIIKFLDLERYSFSYIAHHVYKYNKNEENGFAFFVERGLQISTKTQLNIGLLYVLIRDLLLAIKELQANKIIHLDLALQNFILFCCYNPQGFKQLEQTDLSNSQALAKIIDKIQFKFIDYGDALIVNQLFKKKNADLITKLITSRKEVNELFFFSIQKDMFSEQFQKQTKLLMELTKIQLSKEIQTKIIKIYSNGFEKIIKQMTCLIRNQDKQIVKQVVDLLKKQEEKKIVEEMNKRILQFKQKNTK